MRVQRMPFGVARDGGVPWPFSYGVADDPFGGGHGECGESVAPAACWCGRGELEDKILPGTDAALVGSDSFTPMFALQHATMTMVRTPRCAGRKEHKCVTAGTETTIGMTDGARTTSKTSSRPWSTWVSGSWESS